jgi:hypothetical protein
MVPSHIGATWKACSATHLHLHLRKCCLLLMVLIGQLLLLAWRQACAERRCGW